MPRKFSGAHARIQLARAGLRAEIVTLEVGRCWYPLADYERGQVIPTAGILIDLAGMFLEDLGSEVAGGER